MGIFGAGWAVPHKLELETGQSSGPLSGLSGPSWTATRNGYSVKKNESSVAEKKKGGVYSITPASGCGMSINDRVADPRRKNVWCGVRMKQPSQRCVERNRIERQKPQSSPSQ
jgi:hypothetical protein